MAYVIMYNAKSGRKTYLTETNTFKKTQTDKKVKTFKTPQAAQNYFIGSVGVSDKKKILLSHSKDNFYVVNTMDRNDKFPLQFDRKIFAAKKLNSKNTIQNREPVELFFESIDELTKALRKAQHHALILDLEFFQDDRPDHLNEQHMAQIAGMVLGDEKSYFNYYIFDPNRMSAREQLEFLKQRKDLPYGKALVFNSVNTMHQVEIFLKEHAIDTIISWGNTFDFKTLRDEGFLSVFKGMHAIDLEKTLALANGKVENSDSNVLMSLRAVCSLLNIPNTGQWHVALDDVKMINKLCNLYVNVLAKTDEKTKIYPSNDADYLTDGAVTVDDNPIMFVKKSGNDFLEFWK